MEEAAANGMSEAVVTLADALAYGKLGFDQDIAKAKKLFWMKCHLAILLQKQLITLSI